MPMCFFLTQRRYGYELGRFMLPLHAEPSLDEGTPGSGRYGTHLVEGLDVFGARAAERWPRLKELRNSGVEGAEEMYHLQELMPQRLPGGWSGYKKKGDVCHQCVAVLPCFFFVCGFLGGQKKGEAKNKQHKFPLG